MAGPFNVITNASSLQKYPIKKNIVPEKSSTTLKTASGMHAVIHSPSITVPLAGVRTVTGG